MEGDFPKINGVSRMGDHDAALLLMPSRRLTDDEMRDLHDYLNDPYCRSEFVFRGKTK